MEKLKHTALIHRGGETGRGGRERGVLPVGPSSHAAGSSLLPSAFRGSRAPRLDYHGTDLLRLPGRHLRYDGRNRVDPASGVSLGIGQVPG